MRSSCFIGMTAVLVALSGCGSDTVETPNGTTTTTNTGQGGEGGSGTTTTTTTTTTGEGGAGQGGNGQGGEGGTMTCPGLGDDCTNCAAAQCQQTYCACFNNAECVALVTGCLQNCMPGDDACSQDCLSQHPDGISDALLLGDCTAASCPVECPGAGEELTPCVECLLTSCSTEMNTCFADPDCLALVTCAQNCPQDDQVCLQTCAMNNPGGIGEAQAVFGCADDQCNMGQCNQP